MRPTAGNAALRPAQNSSRSSSEVEARQVTARQALAISCDALDQVIDLGARAVELDDQQRLDVERIAGMDEFLDRMDRRPVHHLHAAGDDAGADDARRRNRRRPRSRKADQHGARASAAFFRMRTVTSVTTPSRPSEPVTMPRRS